MDRRTPTPSATAPLAAVPPAGSLAAAPATDELASRRAAREADDVADAFWEDALERIN